jgi:hypothetical protein
MANPARRGDDQIKTRGYALQAQKSLDLVEDEDRWTILVLLTLLEMVQTPPGLWEEMIALHQRSAQLPEADGLHTGSWRVMAHLILAARLFSSTASSTEDLSFVIQGLTPVFPSQVLTHKQQLRQAFSILARALMIAPAASSAGHCRPLPMNALWQSCWSESQLWYSARNAEMQQIFEVVDHDLPASQQQSGHSLLPVIIFSNTCALMANLTHHLTALYLLQQKPRLIKALADTGSSTSPIWHAQRLVGMVASFDEAEILDPFVVAALLFTARRLSHPAQLTKVVNILRKAEQLTGLKLEEEIDKIEAACKATASL